jgi:hypothetical protein
MTRFLCWILLLLALPLAAQADPPRYVPRRDAMIVYSTAGSQFALPARIVLRYFAIADRIRLDAGGGPYVLLDRTVERVDLVLPDARLAMELPSGAGMTQGFVLGAGLRFRRTGAASVLGRECTTYEVTLENRRASACITADGLVLRGEGSDPSGKAVRVEAVSVNFAPQPPGLFSPPDTYRYVQMPH